MTLLYLGVPFLLFYFFPIFLLFDSVWFGSSPSHHTDRYRRFFYVTQTQTMDCADGSLLFSAHTAILLYCEAIEPLHHQSDNRTENDEMLIINKRLFFFFLFSKNYYFYLIFLLGVWWIRRLGAIRSGRMLYFGLPVNNSLLCGAMEKYLNIRLSNMNINQLVLHEARNGFSFILSYRSSACVHL